MIEHRQTLTYLSLLQTLAAGDKHSMRVPHIPQQQLWRCRLRAMLGEPCCDHPSLHDLLPPLCDMTACSSRNGCCVAAGTQRRPPSMWSLNSWCSELCSPFTCGDARDALRANSSRGERYCCSHLETSMRICKASAQQVEQVVSRLILEAFLAECLTLLIIHGRPKALKHKHRLQLQSALPDIVSSLRLDVDTSQWTAQPWFPHQQGHKYSASQGCCQGRRATCSREAPPTENPAASSTPSSAHRTRCALPPPPLLRMPCSTKCMMGASRIMVLREIVARDSR